MMATRAAATIQSSRPLPAGSRGALARPPFRWVDVVGSPLHDFPIRDEILFQHLVVMGRADVLEVGPGSGFTAFRLAPHVGRLTLLDVAPRAVDELRRTLGHLPNVRFVCADVAASDLTDRLAERFDAAFALDMFEYVTDPATCLKNLAAVLRPGGALLLSFPNNPPGVGDGVTWFADVRVLHSMMERAGFSAWDIVAVRPRPFSAAVYAILHEWPLRLYRRLRAGDKSARPQIYEATWAFQHRDRLARVKVVLHLFWTVLALLMRIGGDVFVREPVSHRPLRRQLVVRAIR